MPSLILPDLVNGARSGTRGPRSWVLPLFSMRLKGYIRSRSQFRANKEEKRIWEKQRLEKGSWDPPSIIRSSVDARLKCWVAPTLITYFDRRVGAYSVFLMRPLFHALFFSLSFGLFGVKENEERPYLRSSIQFGNKGRVPGKEFPSFKKLGISAPRSFCPRFDG